MHRNICWIAAHFRRNRSSASDSVYSYAFLRSVVCLSVVCHIRALCLNRSTDLDATWPVHLWSPVTDCVRWGPWPPGEEAIWGRTHSQSMQLQIAVATWWIETRSDSAFSQITLVLVHYIYAKIQQNILTLQTDTKFRPLTRKWWPNCEIWQVIRIAFWVQTPLTSICCGFVVQRGLYNRSAANRKYTANLWEVVQAEIRKPATNPKHFDMSKCRTACGTTWCPTSPRQIEV